MASDRVEVECPVCDHRIPSDATRCPNCGADFSLSGVDELEKVVQEIDGPVKEVGPPILEATSSVPVVPAPSSPSAGKEEAGRAFAKGQEAVPPSPGGREEERKTDGLFGKLFRKKR